jgi:hypothetical protein
LKPGLPAAEVVGDLVIEDAGADLEQEVCAAQGSLTARRGHSTWAVGGRHATLFRRVSLAQ